MARHLRPSTIKFHRELAAIYRRAVSRGEPLLNAYYWRAMQRGTSRWQFQTCLRYASLSVRNPLVLARRVALTDAAETVQ
jgi:hypothetical protein